MFHPLCKASRFHFPLISTVLLILPTFLNFFATLAALSSVSFEHPAPKALSPKSRAPQWWRIPVERGCHQGILPFPCSANPTDSAVVPGILCTSCGIHLLAWLLCKLTGNKEGRGRRSPTLLPLLDSFRLCRDLAKTVSLPQPMWE